MKPTLKPTTKLRTGLTACTVLALTATLAPLAHAEGSGAVSGRDYTRSTTKSQMPARELGQRSSAAAAATADHFRVAGLNRIETAILASIAKWDDATAGAVVLTRSDNYADALGGSALAGAAGGPLLLTKTAGLDSAVETEIKRVLPAGGTVYVLGGEGSVSAAVATRLTSLKFKVVRLAGGDRYATSAKVAQETGKLMTSGKPQIVFTTTGLNFPDGLAAGATAGSYGSAVVLTKGNVVPPSVKPYLDAAVADPDIDVVAVGGTAAAAPVAYDHVVAGPNRYVTAAMLADDFFGDPTYDGDDATGIGLATGLNWPDALAGGAFMAGFGPLLLTPSTSFHAAAKEAEKLVVNSATPSSVAFGVVFGGTSSVSTSVYNAFVAGLP